MSALHKSGDPSSKKPERVSTGAWLTRSTSNYVVRLRNYFLLVLPFLTTGALVVPPLLEAFIEELLVFL